MIFLLIVIAALLFFILLFLLSIDDRLLEIETYTRLLKDYPFRAQLPFRKTP